MDNSEVDYDELQNIKIVLLGNSGVGKTSLLWKLNNPDYDWNANKPEATIGYEFLTIHEKIKGNQAQIHIWDTTGQDKFNSIASNYFRRAAGAILIYDITDRTSFDSIEGWVNQLFETCEEDVVLMLIGNKFDKQKRRVVSHEEGFTLAEKLKAAFYEASAYTGYNVQISINELINEILKLVYDKSVSIRKSGMIKPKATILSSSKSSSFMVIDKKSSSWKC